MKIAFAEMANAVIRQPSIRRCGTVNMISRSLKVPGSDSLAVAVVAGDARPPAAAAGALDRAQRELAVGRRPAGRDAELPLERLEHLLGADERAGDVRADLDEGLADGLELEHVVERGDRAAVRRRLAQRVGDLAQRVRREPAVALL